MWARCSHARLTQFRPPARDHSGPGAGRRTIPNRLRSPNVAAGQKVIVADLGCVLYDGDKEFVIKKSNPWRGIVRYDLCRGWNRRGYRPSGYHRVAGRCRRGHPAAEYYHLESDWVIEIDITANRADALSHYGVARDLYAWLVQNGYKTSLHRPNCDKFVVDNTDMPIDVKIENTEACKRYACLSITDCDVKEAPNGCRISCASSVCALSTISWISPTMSWWPTVSRCIALMPTWWKAVRLSSAHSPKAPNSSPLTERSTRWASTTWASATPKTPCVLPAYSAARVVALMKRRETWFWRVLISIPHGSVSARRHGLSTDASYRLSVVSTPMASSMPWSRPPSSVRSWQVAKWAWKSKTFILLLCRISRWVWNTITSITWLEREIGKDTIKSIVKSLEMNIDSEDEEGLELTVPAYRVDVQRPHVMWWRISCASTATTTWNSYSVEEFAHGARRGRPAVQTGEHHRWAVGGLRFQWNIEQFRLARHHIIRVWISTRKRPPWKWWIHWAPIWAWCARRCCLVDWEHRAECEQKGIRIWSSSNSAIVIISIQQDTLTKTLPRPIAKK